MKRQSECYASAQIELFEPGSEPCGFSFHPATKAGGPYGQVRGRHAAPPRRDFILAESHHRIKNNLNTILGMIFLQIDRAKSQETVEALQDISARIRGIGVLYDYLNLEATEAEGSVENYFGLLLDSLVELYKDNKTIHIVRSIKDFSLGKKELQLLGMIVSELFTNSIKYAFEGRSVGRIEIAIHRTGRRVNLTYRDDGIGIPDSIEVGRSTGRGLNLLGMMVGQLKASLQMRRENGTAVQVGFAI